MIRTIAGLLALLLLVPSLAFGQGGGLANPPTSAHARAGLRARQRRQRNLHGNGKVQGHRRDLHRAGDHVERARLRAGVPHGMRALNDGACCFVTMPCIDRSVTSVAL